MRNNDKDQNRKESNNSLPRSTVFGNAITPHQTKKIGQWRHDLMKRFHYDPEEKYSLGLVDNEQLGPVFGLKNIVRSSEAYPIDPKCAVVCATTRSGYGLHRGSIAIASCAHHLG